MILFYNSTKKFKFHTHPYINIAEFFFILNMRIFQYYLSYTYIKFHNLDMHKTLYTFILISEHLFFTANTSGCHNNFFKGFYQPPDKRLGSLFSFSRHKNRKKLDLIASFLLWSLGYSRTDNHLPRSIIFVAMRVQFLFRIKCLNKQIVAIFCLEAGFQTKLSILGIF